MAYDGDRVENNEIQYLFNSMFGKLMKVLENHNLVVNDDMMGWGAVMFQKYTIQFFTAMMLTYERTMSPLQQGEYLDIVSINTINRAAFETFLLFEYIYTLPRSKDERNFRFWLYQFHGYKDCQQLSEVGTEEHDKFKEQINVLRRKIRATNSFRELTKIQQDKLLTMGEWKPNWNDIAKEVKLSKHNSSDSYKMMSWFVHNSFAALRATNQYYQSLKGYDVDATNCHLYIISSLYVQSILIVYGIQIDLFSEDELGIMGEFLLLSGKSHEDITADLKRVNENLR